MTRITLPALGKALALLLVLLPLLIMAFFGHQVYADPTKPEWVNVFTGAGAVLTTSVSALVASQPVALVEESQRRYTPPSRTSTSKVGTACRSTKSKMRATRLRTAFTWSGMAVHHAFGKAHWQGVNSVQTTNLLRNAMSFELLEKTETPVHCYLAPPLTKSTPC